MSLEKIYRNPEMKKINIIFIIVLVIGIGAIGLITTYVTDNYNKKLVKQNTIILAECLEGKDINEIANNFYNEKTASKLEEAKVILDRLGYNGLSIEDNRLTKDLKYKYIFMFTGIFIVLLGIIYVVVLRILNGVYKKLGSITCKLTYMSDGEYSNIPGNYNEGEVASLISSLNYMGERVNNSIKLLKDEKNYMKDYLADISHQLKTPLAAIIMFNDLMMENEEMPF